jgi:dTDP-4-dehydrorhamnose reductase
MMRVLVLGVNGMLGHRVARVLGDDVEVWGTSRVALPVPAGAVLDPARHILGVSASDFGTVEDALHRVDPDVVINCIGIVKQRSASKSAVPSIEINALFPHKLARLCGDTGARAVHLSTDCVFTGAKGMYRESDVPDASDMYGRSKLLGELSEPGSVTLRTSIIGWQLSEFGGLLDWYASHRGETINGYRNVFFSGLSTESLARLISRIIFEHPDLNGLYHVSADRIDKYSLLSRLDGLLGWNTEIIPVDEPVMDRSLDSTRFRETIGWAPPSWDDMLGELAADRAWYERLGLGPAGEVR